MQKPILTLMFSVLFLCTLHAQTIHQWGDPRYDWSVMDNQECLCDSTDEHLGDVAINLTEYHTTEEITVYGLAFVYCSGLLYTPYWSMNNSINIRIYQRHELPLDIRLLDSALVTPEKIRQSTMGDTRLLEYDATYPDFYADGPFQYGHRRDTIVEIFFNHPVVVRDSFLIGVAGEGDCYFYFMEHFPYRTRGWNKTACIRSFGMVVPVEQWIWSCSGIHPMVLPILQPRDTVVPNDITPCPAPNAPEMTILEDGQVFIYWDDNPDQSLEQQVAFGTNIAGGPDSNAIVTYRGWFGDFFNYLSPDSTYACWVRNQCRHQCVWHDTLVWGYWSEPLIFSTRDTISDTTSGGSDPNDPHEGIAEAGAEAITLHPNPTSGEVRIECGELSISTVELLDLQGRVLERQEPSNAQSSILNLQSYPTGTYIVRITTTEGTFTRRVSRR